MQFDKIFRYIGYGKEQGAKLLLGGEKRPGKGYFVDPTSELMLTVIEFCPCVLPSPQHADGTIRSIHRCETRHENCEWLLVTANII